MIDSLDRRTAKTLALLDSPEGERIYKRNKYEYGLDHRNNICGIIEKACGRLKWENLIAVYDRVEAELAARKKERMAG
jgi:phage major head subunit gpT-like protein